MMPTVFISYKWGKDDNGNDDFADKVEKALSGKAKVIRDKNSIPAWGSISNFMKSIRQQDFAVLIISNAYLKSTACLYEVVQLMKDEGWAEKTMNVVFDNAGIYDSIKRAEYVQHWEQRRREQERQLDGLPTDSISEITEELKKLKIIALNIGEFLSKVADMNNPPIESAISEILRRLSVVNIPTSPVISIATTNKSPTPIYYKKTEFTDTFLSNDAITLLLNAADDNSGAVYKVHTVLGLCVKIDGYNFVETNNRREEARWESAIDELLEDDILESTDRRNGFYQLTNYGYSIADKLKQQVVSN